MLICLILIDSFYLILDRILVFSFKYVLKPFYPVLQMARTWQTTRKSTGGRAFTRRTIPAPARGDSEGPEDPDDEDDNEDDQDDDPPEERAPYCVYTSFHEEGHFPLLLRDVLNELHNPVAPMYETWHYEDPALGDYYVTRVHIRVDNGPRGMMTVSAHDSSTPIVTYRASVSYAARRAL